jgi:hypothetical protein
MEFTYNNSYQATIGIAPYEALYGRRCWTLVCWEEVDDRSLIGAEIIQMTKKKVKVIKDRMKATQDR